MNKQIPLIADLDKLYEWQIDYCLEFMAQMDNPMPDGVVGMSTHGITGVGKSLATVSAGRIWIDKYGKDARIIIVVPTAALQTQWYKDMTMQSSSMGNISRQGNKKSYDGFSPIVICTINSLKKIHRHPNFENKQVLYILDEAHKCAAKGIMKVLWEARNEGFMQGVVGVSGTIERTDGRCIMDMTGYKAMKLGKRIPHIVYLYRQALRDNVIPPFKIHVYQISWNDLTTDEQEEYMLLTKQAKIAESMAMKEYDITREQMRHYIYADYPLVSKANAKYRERKRLINNAHIRYELAHEIITEYMARGLKALVLTQSIRGCTWIKNRLIQEGWAKPYIYHSGDSPDDWAEATTKEKKEWKDYQRNRNSILSTWLDPRTEEGVMLAVNALTEGINVPELDANCLLASPNTVRHLLQALGRSLRGNRDENGDWIDRYGNPLEHKNIYIVVQGGTTDADKIHYMKQEGDIPDECFITYNRIDGQWVEQQGAHINMSDNDDGLNRSINYYDFDVQANDRFDDDIIIDEDDDDAIILIDNDDDDIILDFDDDDDDIILDFDISDYFDDSPMVFDAMTGEFVPQTNNREEEV